MKRFVLICATLVTVGLAGFLPAASVSAQFSSPLDGACSQNSSAGGSSAACADKGNTANPVTGSNGVIHNATLIIARVTAVIAVIMMVVGGFMYVLSGGDPGKTKTARDTLIYAGVGLVVVLLAQTIIIYVIDRI